MRNSLWSSRIGVPRSSGVLTWPPHLPVVLVTFILHAYFPLQVYRKAVCRGGSMFYNLENELRNKRTERRMPALRGTHVDGFLQTKLDWGGLKTHSWGAICEMTGCLLKKAFGINPCEREGTKQEWSEGEVKTVTAIITSASPRESSGAGMAFQHCGQSW